MVTFSNVCPRRSLDLAMALQNDGWAIVGVYVYWMPAHGYNWYSEAEWIAEDVYVPGLSGNNGYLQDHCDCPRKR
jgi:hypothetical protein